MISPLCFQTGLKFIPYKEPSYASVNRVEFWVSQLPFQLQGLLLLPYSSLHIILSHLTGAPGGFNLGEAPCDTTRLLMCNLEPYTHSLFSFGFKPGQDFCPCLMCRLHNQTNQHQDWHSQFPCGFVSLTLLFPCSFPLCHAQHKGPVACPGSAGGQAGLTVPSSTLSVWYLPAAFGGSFHWHQSLFYSTTDFRDLYKNLMAFKRDLALPPVLVKTDQQIQKLSGRDEQLAHRNLIPLQATQCLQPDLVLTIYAQSCCLAAAAHINLSPVHVLQKHAFTSTHWMPPFSCSL